MKLDVFAVLLALAVGIAVGAVAGGTFMKGLVIYKAQLAGCEVIE